MKTPEGYEKDAIDRYLKWCGCYVVKPTTGGFGQSGHSDRVVCMHGHFLVIEVKREGAKPTPLQWRRMQECEEAGGKAFWGTARKVIGELYEWRVSKELITRYPVDECKQIARIIEPLERHRAESEAAERKLRSE